MVTSTHDLSSRHWVFARTLAKTAHSFRVSVQTMTVQWMNEETEEPVWWRKHVIWTVFCVCMWQAVHRPPHSFRCFWFSSCAHLDQYHFYQVNFVGVNCSHCTCGKGEEQSTSDQKLAGLVSCLACLCAKVSLGETVNPTVVFWLAPCVNLSLKVPLKPSFEQFSKPSQWSFN